MDYSNKTREELISICKEKSIKGYSGKKKEDIMKLLPTMENVVYPGTIRVASLFAGCGGLDYGFHNNSKYSHVFVNDFDKEACATYEKNFKMKPTCGDIKQIYKQFQIVIFFLVDFRVRDFLWQIRTERNKINEMNSILKYCVC